MADFETTSGITLVTDSSNHPFQRVEYSGEVEGDYAIPYVRTVDVNTGEELDRYALISESYWRYDGIQLSTNLPIKALRGEFYSTTDTSPTLDNGPALIIGPRNGVHIEIDQNEIVAKNTATTGGILNLGENTSGETRIYGSNVRINPASNGKLYIQNSALFKTVSFTGTTTQSPGSGANIVIPITAQSGYTPYMLKQVTSNHSVAWSMGSFGIVYNSSVPRYEVQTCFTNRSGASNQSLTVTAVVVFIRNEVL